MSIWTEAEQLAHRAALFVLRLCHVAEADAATIEKDDPLIAQGIQLAVAEAQAKGVPVAQLQVDAADVVKTLQDVADATAVVAKPSVGGA